MRALLLCAFLSLPLMAKDNSITVTVIATAQWAGQFGVRDGRGGLAALKSFQQSLLRAQGSGEVLLFHTGNLTGSENQEGFEKLLARPDPGLPTYLGFAALGPPAREREFARKSKLDMPWALFTTEKTASLLGAGGLVYITALEPPADRTAAKLQDRLEADYREKKSALGVILLPAESASAYFSSIHLPSTHSAHNSTLLFLEPARKNRFYRDPAGPLVCSMEPRAVCVVEFRLREGRIIGISQRFVDLNGKDSPSSFLKPDPALMDLFPGK